jgi:hypothetical protein
MSPHAPPPHLPDPHLWPEIERHHLEDNLCTQAALPHRPFCGARAAALTPAGRAAESTFPPSMRKSYHSPMQLRYAVHARPGLALDRSRRQEHRQHFPWPAQGSGLVIDICGRHCSQPLSRISTPVRDLHPFEAV